MKPDKFLTNLGLSVNFVIIIMLLVVIYYLYLINDNLSIQGFRVGGQPSDEKCQECMVSGNCNAAQLDYCTMR